MAGRLDGKAAVVIGGGRGVGEGVAGRVGAEGAKVVIGDTEIESGKATADRLGARFVETDITKQADAESIVAEALALFGGLDIMVQNAGIYPWTLIEDTSPEEWDLVLGVNLKGCFLATKAALGPMKAQGYGRMVF